MCDSLEIDVENYKEQGAEFGEQKAEEEKRSMDADLIDCTESQHQKQIRKLPKRRKKI